MEMPIGILFKIKAMALGLTAAFALSSCSDTALDEEFGLGQMTQVDTYVTLSFSMPSDKPSRANPNGGEEGDGREVGQVDENRISSAVAFLFQNGDKGVNGDPATPVTMLSFPSIVQSSASPVLAGTCKVNLPLGRYQILAVVNPQQEDLNWLVRQPKLTLGMVRDRIATRLWNVTVNNDNQKVVDYFTMASVADATVTLKANPQNDPAKVTIDVERLAARVDYQAQNSYSCTDLDYSGGTIQILGAGIVNDFNRGTYWMRRVADDSTMAQTYLGKQQPVPSGIATNYVVDPWSVQKILNAPSMKVTEDNGIVKEMSVESFYAAGTFFGKKANSTSWDNPNWWADYVKTGDKVTSNITSNGVTAQDDWWRIGYTMENVTVKSLAPHHYNTGVVFKAKFTPGKNVDGKFAVAGEYLNDGYQAGSTFFAWGKNLYATAEDMMAACYTKEKFDSFAAILKNAKSWEDLNSQLLPLMVSNDPTGYGAYLMEDCKGKSGVFTLQHPKPMSWTEYMKKVCGYELRTSGQSKYVVLDLFADSSKSTRAELKKFNVRTYEDATCYYIWWLRHSNDGNDQTNGIMEYAVVRNNIYKLKVNAVHSLGGDVPGDEKLDVHVYVRNWQMLKQEDIYL